MSVKQLTVVVAGCGSAGTGHIKCVMAHPAVKTVIGVDINAKRLSQLASELGIRTSTDYYKAIKESGVNAVVIASSNETHPPFAIAALNAGKDVFCEKPLGPTLKDCREVVKAARKNKRIFHCHFELRHSKVPTRLKQILDSGEIGEIRSLNLVHYRGPFRPAWKGDPKISGGLSLMETCHSIDLFRYLSGKEVDEVYSFSPKRSIDYYGFCDTEYLVMKMQNGVLSHLTSCHTRSADIKDCGFAGNEWEEEKYGHQYEFNILGSKGAIWYKALRSPGLYIYHHVGEGEHWQCELTRVEDLTHIPFAPQIHGHDDHEFLSAVLEKRETYIAPIDALRTHEVCFAVERSNERNGAVVKPDYLAF